MRRTAVLLSFLVAGAACLLAMVDHRGFLTVSRPLAKADALVVLAGEHRDKVAAAAMLYRDGYVPRILLADDGVFSAWSDKYNRNLYQVEWAEEELVALGVPRQGIIRLPFIRSGTYYDILAAKRYIIENGLKTIILLTSDYHTRRAYWTARQLLRSYHVEIGVFPARSWSLSPLDLTREYMKLLLYPVRYGLFQ